MPPRFFDRLYRHCSRRRRRNGCAFSAPICGEFGGRGCECACACVCVSRTMGGGSSILHTSSKNLPQFVRADFRRPQVEISGLAFVAKESIRVVALLEARGNLCPTNCNVCHIITEGDTEEGLFFVSIKSRALRLEQNSVVHKTPTAPSSERPPGSRFRQMTFHASIPKYARCFA